MPNPQKMTKSLLFASTLALALQASYALAIYGHRGARGLAPENTLTGYKTALAIGVDVIDMDVAITKDRQLVVTHNLGLNPDITRDQSGHYIINSTDIKQLTRADLQQYNVGAINPICAYAKLFRHQIPSTNNAIPSLDEVIHFAQRHAHHHIAYQIEIKTDPTQPNRSFSPKLFATLLAKSIARHHIQQNTEVQSFDFRGLIALHAIDPSIKTAFLTDHNIEKKMRSANPAIAGQWSAGHLLRDYHDSIPAMIRALGGSVWGPEDVTVTAQRVKEAHDLGLKVVPWSWPEQNQRVFDSAQILRLIRSGVDGIITDRPDLLRVLLEKEGIAVPEKEVI